MASDAYRQMLIEATIDDLVLSDALTGIPAHWLRPSLIAAGYDPEQMEKRQLIDLGDPNTAKGNWRDTWSAGQGVGSIKELLSVANLVERLRNESREALEQEQRHQFWSE